MSKLDSNNNTESVYDHLPNFDESYPYIGNHGEELSQCMLNGNIKILQIFGAVYIGKTRLATEVARKYGKSKQPPIHLYMVKMSLCGSREDFLQRMCCHILRTFDGKGSLNDLQLALQLRKNSNLFIIDGVEGSESYLADVLQLLVTFAEDAVFIITSRVHICFGRFIGRGQYLEHLCRPMMPRDAIQLLQTVAGNPNTLNQFEEQIVKLAKRVPMAIILAGQMIKPRPNAINYSPEEIFTLLERSAFDTLNLRYAARKDQIVTVLGDYFHSLNPNEKRFFLRLEKRHSVDSFTTATACETAPEIRLVELKKDILEPIVDKTLISSGAADDHGGRTFQSNEWLSDYIKEHFPTFIAHSGDGFADRICDFIVSFLKSRGYEQSDIDKVYATKTTLTRPLKEALSNLIVWDYETPEECRFKNEKTALRVQVIEAAAYLLRIGFPDCKPIEFVKGALKILTEMEDPESSSITMVNGNSHLDRQPIRNRGHHGSEPMAKVSLITRDQAVQEYSSSGQFTPIDDVRPFPLQKQAPSFVAAENIQIQGHANSYAPTTHAMLPVSSTNNKMVSVCNMSTMPDHTRLLSHESASVSEQIILPNKINHVGTLNQAESCYLKSSESWGAGWKSSVSQGQQYDDSVFDTDGNYTYVDSEIHPLKSHPTGTQEIQGIIHHGQERPTDCANYRLSVTNTEETCQRQKFINSHAIAQAESYRNAKQETDSNHLQSTYIPPQQSQDHAYDCIKSQTYHDKQQIDQHFHQMTPHSQDDVSVKHYSPSHTNGQLSSRETNQVRPLVSSPNHYDHLVRYSPNKCHDLSHKPNNMIPRGGTYQAREFEANFGNNSRICNQVSIFTPQKSGFPHSEQSDLPTQNQITADHRVLSSNYNNINQTISKMDSNHQCKKDVSDNRHISQSRSDSHSGYPHDISDPFGLQIIPNTTDTKYTVVQVTQQRYSNATNARFSSTDQELSSPPIQSNSQNNPLIPSSMQSPAPPKHIQFFAASNQSLQNSQFSSPLSNNQTTPITSSKILSTSTNQISPSSNRFSQPNNLQAIFVPKNQLTPSNSQCYLPSSQFATQSNQVSSPINQSPLPKNSLSSHNHSSPPSYQSFQPNNQFSQSSDQHYSQKIQFPLSNNQFSPSLPSNQSTFRLHTSNNRVYPPTSMTMMTLPSSHYPLQDNQFQSQIPQYNSQCPLSLNPNTPSATPPVSSSNQQQYPGQHPDETTSCRRPHTHYEGHSSVHITCSSQTQTTQSRAPVFNLQSSASSHMNIPPQQAQSHSRLPFQPVPDQTKECIQGNLQPPYSAAAL